MTRSLILDTSTERGIVALIDNHEVKFQSLLPFGLQTAHFLLPELQKGLQQTSLKLTDLDFIGVGVGPGSYTGLRVGAMVAKTLSFAWQVPLVGICTLEGFVPTYDTAFAAVIDAKIGGVYIEIGHSKSGEVSYTFGPSALPLEEAVDKLMDIPTLVSANASPLEKKFRAIHPSKTWQWLENYPSPLRMAEMGQRKFKSQEYSLDGRLELLYMRKTQAEIEKESRK